MKRKKPRRSKRKRAWRVATAAGIALSAAAATVGTTAAAEPAAGRYQIVEATPERVWRLDTQTGAIAVCRLDAGALICLRSDGREPAEAAAERRTRESVARERQLAFLERMLDMARAMIRHALGREAGTPAASPPAREAP
jgi:hypothetical protein